MDPERIRRVETIVEAALAIEPEADRETRVAAMCGDDAELRAEVERRLEPLGDAGRRIDAYELKGEIGRGGMGAVYLAERADGEFRRKVALKLIKRGMDTEFIVARFRRERQILASLDHPNVARLLGGGTSPEGLPYFVMEYVEGKPINDYCDAARLGVDERLRLFLEVCGAVGAAHRIRVVHRDLKPSNILVDKRGRPKLLDFGIAKILDPELASATLEPTATQMRMMTPEYASPEQVRGEPVTPASDVYGLGVVLYELLTGHRPYRLRNRALHEIHRAVCEEPPRTPSENLDEAGGDLVAPTDPVDVFRRRGTDREGLRAALAGSLDRVLLKALRKDAAERYQTVDEFAADLERCLARRPVMAESFPSSLPLPEPAEPAATPSTGERKSSIAILPFRTFAGGPPTGGGDVEFLGVGLADALVTRLSVISRIVVRPTSSVIAFGDAVDPFRAGRELDVEFVVDGNIRRAGTRLRVTVQLLSVASNSTIWAQTFDQEFTDLLDVEDSISARVASSLAPQLAGDELRRFEKRGTNDAAAHREYLRGRYFASQFSGEALESALACYREAVRLDDGYALPHVGIADIFVWSAVFGQFAAHEAFPIAKAEIGRALEIDDGLGEAYALKAFITLLYDWDWDESERIVRRALELNPNFGFAHECLSNLFSTRGRFDEAVREIRRAEELDPLSPRAKLMTSWTLYIARRYPEAIAKAAEANAMRDDFAMALVHLGSAQTPNGEAETAVVNLRRAAALWPGNGMPRFMLCFALAAAGRVDEAREVLAELLRPLEVGTHVKPYYAAMAYAAVGDLDAAFEWFEKSAAARDEWMIWFGVDASLDPLRRDPRYLALLRRTNNPIYAAQAAAPAVRAAAPGASIAVLPLRLIGAAGLADAEFLGLGLTDALINRLSSVRRLAVRPTSSVLKFQDPARDAAAAGRELQVDYVVDGSLRSAGDRVRVSLQLLRVGGEQTLWARNFDERLNDVLELEDSISEQVAAAMIPELTTVERADLSRRETNDPAAYEAYLRGRFHWNQFTPEAFPKAIAAFRRASEIDPGFALAHVGIADFNNWAGIYGLMPPGVAQAEADRAARRAIEINPRLGEAYATLGLIYQNRFEWEEAERIARESLRLAPNYAYGHEALSARLIGSGRTEEGLDEMRTALELDPLSLRTRTLAAWSYYQAHRFEEALEIAERILELDPDYPQGYTQKGYASWGLGRYDDALANFQRFDALSPDLPMAKFQLCFAYVSVGREGDARRVREEIEALAARGYVKTYFRAMADVALGELDRAFARFAESVAEHEPWLLWFGTEPMLAALRRDPRHRALLVAMKNPLASS